MIKKLFRNLLFGILSVLLITGGSTATSVSALTNEFFRVGNDILFSSPDAGKLPSGDFVYYSQLDYPDNKYGSSTIKLSGCAPTSFAMIVASLVDNSVTPIDTAAMGERNGSFIEGVGTAHAPLLFSSEATSTWPMTVTALPYGGVDAAVSYLKSHKNTGYIYMGGKGSPPFTSGGHVIVLRGLSEDENSIIVADPYRGAEDVYTINQLKDAGPGTTYGFTK